VKSPLNTPRHITSQILLAVLVPVVILTCIITAYYAYSRYQEIEHTQVQMGKVTTSYLAQAAELGVYAADLLELRDLADATLNRAAVNSIYFLDSSAELILKKGDVEHLLGASELDRQQLVVVSDDNNLHFARPMLSKPIDIDDFYLSEAGRTEAGRTQTKTIGWVVLSLSRDEMRTQVYQMIYTAVLVALGSILIGVLFALKAGSAIGRPVRELSTHIKHLDKTQSPTQFKARGSIETMVLSKGINSLVSNIDSQIRDQQRQIKQATEDLTRRNQQLQDAHQVLEQALQAKEDFLARMSHELRTPLTTIIGFNRLTSSAGDREQAQEYSHHIEHASELLSSIINDILDYSKMQSAKLELETIAFNIEDCFEDVVGMHGHEAVSKQVALVFLIDADVPVNVIGDRQRLQQIVNNLLSNAFRFTDQGEIIVRLTVLQKRQHRAVLHCEIRDSGIGIATQEQQRVFQAFTQADNSITRKHGGTGLGLTISRALVQMMHGEIALDSAPGRGTTVVFSFSVGLDSDSEDSRIHAQVERRSPVLAYDSNDWSRRALRSALLNWSLDVAVYSHPAELISRLRGSDPSAMLVLSLRHDEALVDSLVTLLGQIRDTYPGPIIVVSPIPELEQQLGANIKLDTMRFALKPMRRRNLLALCDRLAKPLDGTIPAVTKAPLALRGLRLLVAEDHQPIRELLKRILEAAGAIVDCVGDGSEAVAASMEHSYELMLMDLHMPGMDGISATQSIRGQGCTTPIVCLTADINAHEDLALSDAGVNAVMLKPIEEDKLLQLVCQLCGIAYQADTQSPVAVTPIADEQLRATMSQLLANGRSAFDNQDLPRYQAVLHDMLGLAGLYQEKMLHEMIREIKIEDFALSPEEAQHLFDEIAILIQKY
jgi:two-component system sensor histidine kinase BarA